MSGRAEKDDPLIPDVPLCREVPFGMLGAPWCGSRKKLYWTGLGFFRICVVSLCSPNLHVKTGHPESVCYHAVILGSEGGTLWDEIGALCWGVRDWTMSPAHDTRDFIRVLSPAPGLLLFCFFSETPLNSLTPFHQVGTEKEWSFPNQKGNPWQQCGARCLDLKTASHRNSIKESFTTQSRELWDRRLGGQTVFLINSFVSPPATRGTQNSPAPKLSFLNVIEIYLPLVVLSRNVTTGDHE